MPTAVRQQQLPELPVNAGLPPNAEQGPRVIAFALSFATANTPYTDDLQVEGMMNSINNVQTLFIDNNNNGTFSITFLQTGQTVRVGAFKQGFYPILTFDGVTYSAQHSLAGASVNLAFCNFPIGYSEWNTNAANQIAITPPGAPNSPQTPVTGSSGNVAATATSASLPAVAGKTEFITGFEVTGAGATGASNILVTVTGVVTGTLTYNLVIPAGVNTSITPLIVEFATPIAASAPNTAITVNVPSFGAGNTNASVVVHGFNQ